jgi:hypothetical protein
VAEELADAHALESHATLWRGRTARMSRSIDTVMDAPNRRSMPRVQRVWIAQWSPLLFAMWSLPAVAAFAVVKQNYSLALLGARGRQRLTAT